MYQVTVQVQDSKYNGKFNIESEIDVAHKVINSISPGCMHQDIWREIESLEVGESGGYTDIISRQDVVWIKKLS